MKKRIAFFLALLAVCAPLAACRTPGGEDGTFRIVATVFPIYDWVREIVGDTEGVEVTLLQDDGADLHNYEPTSGDIVTVSECDLFLCVGGASDAWVDTVLSATGREIPTLRLLSVPGVGVKAEEIKEGMEADGDPSAEPDEHVWLSLRNAEVLCSAIADALGEADPAHASAYAENCAAYLEALGALDARYAAAAEAAAFDTLLFADRFPFRYLADDYGLDYFAAFTGCNAETAASFETVIFLSKKLDALALPCVLTTEEADGSLVTAVTENTTAGTLPVLVMDSMQSVTGADVDAGVTYLSVMEQNLAVLREALGAK